MGDGNFTNLSPPVAVSGLSSGVSALVAGNSHTCAVAVDGAAKCWGDNSYGQMGDGSTTTRSTPVAVSGLTSGVSALAAGWYHTCALTGGGAVKCWGENFDGQMGDGTMGYRPLASLFVVELSLISGATGQTITFGAAPSVVVGGTGTVSATATSGLAVSFTSSTPASICTVSSTGTVTGVSAGTCIIAADQAGDASYNAAAQVTQSLTITSTPFSISPSSASASAAGLAGNISVTADTGSAWTATSNASWITVTSGSSGNGSGTVVYAVAVNTGASSRTGTLTIGGQTFTVTQAVDAAAYANQVQAMYIAYFGRPADPGGLVNFEAGLLAAGAPTNIQDLLAAYNTNATVKSLVDGFGTSAESNRLYTGDNTAFVTAVFNSVLNRPPLTAGKDFWVLALDNGRLTKGNAALSIMAGALANTSTQGLIDAALVNNKLLIGSNFTSALATTAQVNAYSGQAAAATVRAMLATVSETTDSAAFQATITSTVAQLVATTAP